jgi:hypothetical protein
MSRHFHTETLRDLQARSVCPTCHRPIPPTHCGLAWSLTKGAILDLLARRGEAGAGTAEILDTVYANRKRPKPQCIKSHIAQIRDVLETEAPHYRVVREDGRWVLRRSRK